METTWKRSATASGSAASSWLASTVRSLWSHWRAARLRAAEQRALAELSPGVLHDIGADPEAIHHAQQRLSGRDAVMRLM